MDFYLIRMKSILTICGEKDVIEEFKEKLDIDRMQMGECSLKIIEEINFKKLKKEWTKRIQNTSGIIYRYIQKELINSFIKDIEKYLI